MATASGVYSNVRYPFARQPGQCVIVDLSTTYTQDNIEAVCNGITRFSNLLCLMKNGPRRVPHFSILCALTYPEVLLPFIQLNNESHTRIQGAVEELRRLSRETTNHCGASSVKMLEQALREAVNQFHKFKRNDLFFSKLEVTVMCFRPPQTLLALVKTTLTGIDISDIPRVTLFGMAPTGDYPVPDDITLSNDDADLTGILELVSGEVDSVCVEMFLRRLLSDKSTDREHVHLYFNSGLRIKCDLQERVLDPSEFIFSQHFVLSSNADHIKNVQLKAVKPGESVPITQLQIIQQVPSASVCESVLFGHPYVMYNSRCWRMEWNELETNQNRFITFSQYLIDNDVCVVCKNITQQSNKRGRIQLPTALFLIMAAPNPATLLIKSIASGTLLLDCDLPNQQKLELTSLQARAEIINEMSKVERQNTFNPLFVTDVLSASFTNPHNAISTKQPNKTKRSTANQTNKAKAIPLKIKRFLPPRQDRINK
uniref:meiosis 1 arrest protein-like n=1 Tax=Ciona intestinalis TaxID=7719 RepID=UPI000180C681|nr:meiosis 1 arrest protein-like [Ciona intestinalis]|eukprot:XP_009858700.1 meiosis 1 arrest protein-like [Ciona intestinalis]